MDSIEFLWPSFSELSTEQIEKIQKNSSLIDIEDRKVNLKSIELLDILSRMG